MVRGARREQRSPPSGCPHALGHGDACSRTRPAKRSCKERAELRALNGSVESIAPESHCDLDKLSTTSCRCETIRNVIL